MKRIIYFLMFALTLGFSTGSLSGSDMKGCNKFQERQGLIYLPNMDDPYTGVFRCIRDYDAVGQYEEGLKTGVWTEYSGGMKQLQGEYRNGEKFGLWKEFKYGGDVIGEFEYLNDKLHGLYTSYYSNGQRSERGRYSNGVKDGIFKQWHSNGQKLSEVLYESDNKSGKYQSWHSNGSVSESSQFDGGDLTGKYVSYDGNGNALKESNFVDGKLHGLSIEREIFKPDGKLYLVSETNYKHGEKHGEAAEYRTGEIYSKLRQKYIVVHKQTKLYNYVNGKKHGLQVWVSNCCNAIDDGYYSKTSVSNYKNGRQYYELQLENDRRRNKKIHIKLISWGGGRNGHKVKDIRVAYKKDKYETTLYEDDKSVRMSFAAAMWKELVEKKYLNNKEKNIKKEAEKSKSTASKKKENTNTNSDDVKKKLIKSLFGF